MFLAISVAVQRTTRRKGKKSQSPPRPPATPFLEVTLLAVRRAITSRNSRNQGRSQPLNRAHQASWRNAVRASPVEELRNRSRVPVSQSANSASLCITVNLG